MKAKLDAFTVQTAHCPEGRSKLDLYDDQIKGFILEVRANQSKTFALRYRDELGRQRQVKIGDALEMTADRARKQALKLKSRVVVGENPAVEKQTKRSIPTYAELSEKYVAHIRTYQRDPETAERYLRNHIVPKWGRMRLTEIHQADVAAWLALKGEQGMKPGTVERMRVVFSHSFKLARTWGIPGSDVNPLVGIPRPPLNNAVERSLTTEQAQRLRNAVEGSRNPQLKFIVGLLLLTGARVSELLQAQWQDLDLERQLWRVPLPKGGRARYIPISQGALDLITQLPRFDGCPYLVPNPDTKQPYVGIFMSWDTARKKAGLPTFRIHDLRHSAASFMICSGIDLYTVGKILGHRNYKTTQRYAHLANDVLLAGVEAGAARLGVNWASDPAK